MRAFLEGQKLARSAALSGGGIWYVSDSVVLFKEDGADLSP
jgi:hypothetical protein